MYFLIAILFALISCPIHTSQGVVKTFDEPEDMGKMMSDGYLSVVYTRPSKIAASTHGAAIHKWSISAGSARRVATLEGHTTSVGTIACNKHARRLASGSNDGSIIIWHEGIWNDGSEPAICCFKDWQGAIKTLSFLGPERLVSGGPRTNLRIWDIEIKKPIKGNKKVRPWYVTALNRSSFISTYGRGVRIHDKSNGEYFYRISLDTPSESGQTVTTIDHGNNFAVADGRCIKLFDTRKLSQPLRRLEHTSTIHVLARCGRYLAAHSRNEHTIKLWDVENSKSGELVRVISAPHLEGLALAGNEEGTSLTMAIAGNPGFMQTWNFGLK